MTSAKLTVASMACSSLLLLGLGETTAQTTITEANREISKAESAVRAGQGRGDGAGGVREAILANTILRGGKRYPKMPTIAAGKRSSDGVLASCEIGDLMSVTNVASINLQGPKKAKKDVAHPPTGPMDQMWSPPNTDWVIQSYSRVITSKGGTTADSDTAVPSGYSSNAAGSYNTVRQATHDYVLSLSIPDIIKAELNAQIDTMVSNTGSYTSSLTASHGSVRHLAQVWGTGVANFSQAHSWYEGHINAQLICAPAYLRDPNVYLSRLKQWVDSTVASLPRQLTEAQRVDGTAKR